jgi:hypothetical protein
VTQIPQCIGVLVPLLRIEPSVHSSQLLSSKVTNCHFHFQCNTLPWHHRLIISHKKRRNLTYFRIPNELSYFQEPYYKGDQIRENKMGGECSTQERRKMCTVFWLEILKGRDYTKDLGVGGKIMLRGPFVKFVDWWQCAVVMQREVVTVMSSCSGGWGWGLTLLLRVGTLWRCGDGLFRIRWVH